MSCLLAGAHLIGFLRLARLSGQSLLPSRRGPHSSILYEALAGRGLCRWPRSAGDLPRQVLGGVAAEAELAVVVEAPAPQSPDGADAAGVIRADGDVGPGDARAYPAGSHVLSGADCAGVAGRR